jgi:hypothetical protein
MAGFAAVHESGLWHEREVPPRVARAADLRVRRKAIILYRHRLDLAPTLSPQLVPQLDRRAILPPLFLQVRHPTSIAAASS